MLSIRALRAPLRAACRVRTAVPIHAALRFGAPAAVPFYRGIQNSAVTTDANKPLADITHNIGKPSIEEAKYMPHHFYQMSHDVLQVLAGQGNEGARAERMIREIMAVDEVSWDDAQDRFEEMRAFNNQYAIFETLPYKVGIVGATGAGILTIPLCFFKDTVTWFNKDYVTMEVPPPEDLETWLEVGSWSWNWMEPPLGQLSFLLLCLQFSRAQMNNIGARPFTGMIQTRKASALTAEYPMYESNIVQEFARSDSKLDTDA